MNLYGKIFAMQILPPLAETIRFKIPELKIEFFDLHKITWKTICKIVKKNQELTVEKIDPNFLKRKIIFCNPCQIFA